MALDTEYKKELVNLYWSKALQTKEEAVIAINNKKWSMAANRIYYFLFHAITALLVKDGHK